jgi:LEA14-like dessication related protein
MRRKLTIAAVLAAGIALGAGCALLSKAVQKPSVAFERLSVRSISLDEASVDVHLNVQNPNVFDVPLKKYTFGFAVGESTVLTGEQLVSVTIPARGSGPISIPLTIRFRDVMNAVNAVRTGDVIPYAVNGTVTIDAGPLAGYTVPFSHSGSIPRPELPSVTVQRMNVRSMSFTGIDADLVIGVRNPGKLGYALSSFAGSLDLNGTKFATIDRIQGTQRMAGGASQTVTIPLHFSAAQALSGLQGILQSGTINYRIYGTAGLSADIIGNLPIALDHRGTTQISR